MLSGVPRGGEKIWLGWGLDLASLERCSDTDFWRILTSANRRATSKEKTSSIKGCFTFLFWHEITWILEQFIKNDGVCFYLIWFTLIEFAAQFSSNFWFRKFCIFLRIIEISSIESQNFKTFLRMKVPLLSESRDTWPGLRMEAANSKKSGCETWDNSKNKKKSLLCFNKWKMFYRKFEF